MSSRKRLFILAASLAGILAANGVTLDFSRSIGPVPLVYGLARPPNAIYDNWSLGSDLDGDRPHATRVLQGFPRCQPPE